MAVLLMMTLGNWLIISFGMVVKGRIHLDMILELMLYQIPQLLEFILPLSIFIGLMLSLSRQYVEHEVTIIKSSGFSPRQYAQLLTPLILVCFILQAGIILYAKPAGLYATEKMKAERAIKSAFDLIKPKEFIHLNQYSLYVGGFSKDKRSLTNVILIERNGAPEGRDRIILANKAEQVIPTDTNKETPKPNPNSDKITQLDLIQGRQYELGADSLKYNRVSFEKYRATINIPQKNDAKKIPLEAESTYSLLKRIADRDAMAETVYRLTVPFVIWLALALALPLSHVSPRKGRWIRLVPSILLYATSVLVMNAVKGGIIKGKLPVILLPVILVAYALFGIYLYQKNKIHRTIKTSIKKT